MGYIDSWTRQAMMDLMRRGRRSRAANQLEYNQQYGAGTTQSGSFQGGLEGIAGREAVEASGITEMAAAMRREEEEERRRERELAKQQRMNAVLGAVGGLAGAVLPGLMGRMGGGGAAQVVAPAAAPAGTPGMGQMAEAMMGQGANMSDNMSMQLQPGLEIDPKLLRFLQAYGRYRARKPVQPFGF